MIWNPRRHGLFAEFDMVSGIYKITNQITGNCYIGKSTNIRQRFKQHKEKIKRGYKSNPKWAEDIRLYGIDVFKYELLEEIPHNEWISLALAERQWFSVIRPEYNKACPLVPRPAGWLGIVKIENQE